MGTTFTCVATGDWDDDATWGLTDSDYPGKSGSTDDVVIIDVANKSGGAGALTVTLVADVTIKAIKMAGTGSGDATLHTASEHTLTLNDTEFSGYSAHITGQTEFTGNVNFTFTKSGVTHIIIDPASQTNKLNDLNCNHASLALHLLSNITLKGNLNVTNGHLSTIPSGGGTSYTVICADLEISDTSTAKFLYNDSTVTAARVGVGLGGVGRIDGSETGKIIVNGTGNARILDLAGAILTGTVPTFEYQGQATTATQALSGLTSGVFNLIVNSDGATEKCIPNGSVIALNDLTMTDGEFELPSSTNIEAAGDLIIAAAGVADLNPASSDGNVTFRSVVISSGGTLEAPSHGSFTLTGSLSAWSFQNNSDNFSHNNGTITQTAAGHIKSVSAAPMYNFTMNSGSSDTHEAVFRPSTGSDMIICANELTITRGVVLNQNAAHTQTMGSLNITATTGSFQAASTTTTITKYNSGNNAIYANGPITHNSGTFAFTNTDDYSGIEIQIEGGAGSAGTYFNDVTFSGNSTYRFPYYGANDVTISGDLTMSGTPDVKQWRRSIIVDGNVTIGDGCTWDCEGSGVAGVSSDFTGGGITIENNGTFKASSNTTTFKGGASITANRCMKVSTNGVFTPNGGTLTITGTDWGGSNYAHLWVPDGFDFGNIEINAGGADAKYYQFREGSGTMHFGNVYVKSGEWRDYNNNNTFNIRGNVDVGTKNTGGTNAAFFGSDARDNANTTKSIIQGIANVHLNGQFHVPYGSDGTDGCKVGGIREVGGTVYGDTA